MQLTGNTSDKLCSLGISLAFSFESLLPRFQSLKARLTQHFYISVCVFEQCTNKSGSTVVQVTALSDEVDLSLVNSKGKNLNQMYGASPSTIDKYSRVIFPVCFTCFHLMYWLIYLHISDEIAEGLTLHNPNP